MGPPAVIQARPLPFFPGLYGSIRCVYNHKPFFYYLILRPPPLNIRGPWLHPSQPLNRPLPEPLLVRPVTLSAAADRAVWSVAVADHRHAASNSVVSLTDCRLFSDSTSP